MPCRRHTLAFDGRIVYETQAEHPCAGELGFGTGWRLAEEKLTLESDDVVVMERCIVDRE